MLMKNSNDTIENRTRNLPTSSAVPEPTAQPRTKSLCKTFKQLIQSTWNQLFTARKTHFLYITKTKWLSVLKEGYTNPRRRVAVATKLPTVATNVRWSSLRNLLHLTLLASRMFWWLMDFWRINTSLCRRFRCSFSKFQDIRQEQTLRQTGVHFKASRIAAPI